MRTPILIPTLAALAAVPTAQAFEVAGDQWTLSIEPRLQSRIEFASASDAGGDDYDIWEETSTDNPQAVNFYMRRVRLYMKGKSDDGWKFNFTLRADKIGISDDAGGTDPEVYYVWVGKEIESGDMKHFVNFGLDKHTSSLSMWDSSSKALTPNAKLVEQYAGPRSVGINYQLTAPMFRLAVGLADEAESPVSGFSDNNDWQFYARAVTGFKEEWTLAKRSESYLGKEGFGHLLGLGFDVHTDGSDAGAGSGTEDDGSFVLNLDYLVHYNQITGLVAISSGSVGDAATNGEGDEGISFTTLVLQAGYAIPLENGTVAEVGARVTYVDNDTDFDDEAGTLDQEGGDSGVYFDLGFNYYLDGHSNKFQAGLQSYSPEEGDGSGVAIRLAHQLDF